MSIARRCRRSKDAGYEFFAGLEVEFHLFKLEKTHLGLGDAAQPGQPGAPPEVSLLNQGYQYLTESRYDEMDPILEILRTNIAGLALPLRSLEVEFGPSQVEFTFRAGTGLEPADAMVLFRSATKQVAQRNGYHATFMCRPKLPNVMSSGWHLHQSLKDKSGANAFADPKEPLSAGRQAVDGGPAGACARRGGVLDADAQRLQALPPLLARARSRDLGPRQSRRDGAGAGRARRSGEPSREPGRRAGRQSLPLHGEPGRERPRRAEAPGRSRPVGRRALRGQGAAAAAIARRGAGGACARTRCFRAGFGDFFVDYYLKLKQAEIDRFNAEVSDWEQREYFSTF